MNGLDKVVVGMLVGVAGLSVVTIKSFIQTDRKHKKLLKEMEEVIQALKQA